MKMFMSEYKTSLQFQAFNYELKLLVELVLVHMLEPS